MVDLMIITMISGMIDDHHVQNICSLNIYYIFACLYNIKVYWMDGSDF